MLQAPTTEERIDQEWDDDYNKTMGSMYFGRSQTTGY